MKVTSTVCTWRSLRLLAALASSCALAFDAAAQPASDPIGAVLQAPAVPPSTPPPSMPPADEDSAEAATAPPPAVPAPAAAPPTTYARPPQAAPYSPFPVQPRAYARPVTPSVTSPVHIDETGRTPDRPLTPYDLNYDARLRASSASAQGMMGPLDGSWTLNIPGEGDVFVLELVDRGGPLEGAWRDLRRIGALGASGFVDDIQRTGAALTLRISTGSGGGTSVASLTAQPDGRWSGELDDRGRRKFATLRRN